MGVASVMMHNVTLLSAQIRGKLPDLKAVVQYTKQLMQKEPGVYEVRAGSGWVGGWVTGSISSAVFSQVCAMQACVYIHIYIYVCRWKISHTPDIVRVPVH